MFILMAIIEVFDSPVPATSVWLFWFHDYGL